MHHTSTEAEIVNKKFTRQLSDDTTVDDLGHISRSIDCFSPVAEEPNLAMSGNNRFSAFFSRLYYVVQESVGCTDFPLLAFSKFKMASNML